MPPDCAAPARGVLARSARQRWSISGETSRSGVRGSFDARSSCTVSTVCLHTLDACSCTLRTFLLFRTMTTCIVFCVYPHLARRRTRCCPPPDGPVPRVRAGRGATSGRVVGLAGRVDDALDVAAVGARERIFFDRDRSPDAPNTHSHDTGHTQNSRTSLRLSPVMPRHTHASCHAIVQLRAEGCSAADARRP